MPVSWALEECRFPVFGLVRDHVRALKVKVGSTDGHLRARPAFWGLAWGCFRESRSRIEAGAELSYALGPWSSLLPIIISFPRVPQDSLDGW